jgi:Fur family transcriptional regulator, iron response regulator
MMFDAQSQPAKASLAGCPVADLTSKLRRVGLRPTRQRVLLGWLLFGKANRHVTADQALMEP